MARKQDINDVVNLQKDVSASVMGNSIGGETHKFSELEKQQRYEAITAKEVGARPRPQFTKEVLSELPNKSTDAEGWNVATVLPGPIWGHHNDFEYVLPRLQKELKN